jgi:hypothetical protein
MIDISINDYTTSLPELAIFPFQHFSAAAPLHCPFRAWLVRLPDKRVRLIRRFVLPADPPRDFEGKWNGALSTARNWQGLPRASALTWVSAAA